MNEKHFDDVHELVTAIENLVEDIENAELEIGRITTKKRRELFQHMKAARDAIYNATCKKQIAEQEKTMQILLRVAERVANDREIPPRLVHWACDVYDILVNREAHIKVEDLLLLEQLAVNYENGIVDLSYTLAARNM